MNKELKNLLDISKKTVKKETYRKLKKIKDKKELKSVAEYSILSVLKQEQLSIENIIKKLEKEGKDTFFVRNKSDLIISKIKHFQVEFDKEEFYKLSKLLNEVKNEIKCLIH